MTIEAQQEANQQETKRKAPVAFVFAISLVVALALGAAAFLALQNLSGVNSDAARDQQAAYVTAAVNRVEANEAGGGYWSVVRALSGSDAVPGRYWVLSSNGIMLYAQDEPGANLYLGRPVREYPVLADTASLYESLAEGAVSSEKVTAGGVDYLVSGTRFTYDHADYELCLVCSADALKSASDGAAGPAGPVAYALIVVLMALIVAVPTALAARSGRKAKKRGQGAGQGQDASTVVEEPAPYPAAQATAESETECKPGQAVCEPRPFEDLHPYVEGLLATGEAGDASMVRVDFHGQDQLRAALRSLGEPDGRLRECFVMGETSIVVVLDAADAGDAAKLLEPHLQGRGAVSAVVPIR